MRYIYVLSFVAVLLGLRYSAGKAVALRSETGSATDESCSQLSEGADEPLKQRICSVESEIKQLQPLIAVKEEECTANRSKAAEASSETLVDEIEHDNAFAEVNAEAFNTYLQHSFKVVREWALCKKDLSRLQGVLAELRQQMQLLEEDKMHMKKTPAELYRYIQDLKEQLKKEEDKHEDHVQQSHKVVQTLQAQLHDQHAMILALQKSVSQMAPLRLLFEEKRRKQHLIQEQNFYFTPRLASNWNHIKFQSSFILSVGSQSSSMEYVERDYSTITPEEQYPTFAHFAMKVTAMPTRSDTVLEWGVWFHNGSYFTAEREAWAAGMWQLGDMAVIEFDPSTMNVRLYHHRLNTCFMIANVANPPHNLYRLRLSLKYPGTEVNISRISDINFRGSECMPLQHCDYSWRVEGMQYSICA